MQPAADPRRIDESNQLYFKETRNQADKAEIIDVKGWADTVQTRCPDYFSCLSGLYSQALLASVLEMTFAMVCQIQPTNRSPYQCSNYAKVLHKIRGSGFYVLPLTKVIIKPKILCYYIIIQYIIIHTDKK